jgi:hypothetical protein
MLLFRSEEHVERWLTQTGRERGSLISLEQLWELGQAWYGTKLDPDWRRNTPEETRATFQRVGLDGEFWWLA